MADTEDIFDDEKWLTCDDCGHDYPKSYLKRCKICGKVVCERCRPNHHKTHHRVKVPNKALNTLFNVFGVLGGFISSAASKFRKVLSFDKSDLIKGFGLVLVAVAVVGVVVLSPYILPYTYTPDPHIVLDERYDDLISDSIHFEWRGKEYSVDVTSEMAIYKGSKLSESDKYYGEFWDDYYIQKTTDPMQDLFYEQILEDLRDIKATENLNSDEYAELIVTFVQAIPYDDYAKTSPRYPIAVFFDGKGDCDEKSMLACGLLSKEGYDVALFDFIDAAHMSAAIKTTSGEGYCLGYAFVETTGPSLIGEIPTFDDGLPLDKYPDLYIIGEGTLTYNSYHDVENIMKYREALDSGLKKWVVDVYSSEEVNRYNEYIKIRNYLFNCYAGNRDTAYSLVLKYPLPNSMW